jgi:Holliday junction resolvase-like predicted endonuclease
MSFQGDASRDGADFHKVCVAALERYGFRVTHNKFRVADCGVEVDIVAENENGIRFMIECKGGYNRGVKPGGLKSSDNVRKAIASAYCLSRSLTHVDQPHTPLVVMTTEMTPHTSANFDQLSVVQTSLMMDIISDRDYARLKYWFKADWYRVQSHIATFPTVDWAVRDNPFWKIPASVPELWR